MREKSHDNVLETALACDITTLSCHHLDHATHDHLTTSTVNTDHVTTSTVPHNNKDGLDGRCMEDTDEDTDGARDLCVSSPWCILYIYFIFTPLIFHYKQTMLREPKRLCHPPTMIGVETRPQMRLHLLVCFFYIPFSYFINEFYYLL